MTATCFDFLPKAIFRLWLTRFLDTIYNVFKYEISFTKIIFNMLAYKI